MPKNKKVVEIHGCIVCGKLHEILVIYTPDGQMVDCALTSPGAHCVADEKRPLVACNKHTAEQVDNALAKHYPGKEQDEGD